MYGRIGRGLFDAGQFQKSIPWLKLAKIVKSDDPGPPVTLAIALFKLEKENEAFSSIKKALSESHSLYNFLIETLEEKQKIQDLESISTEIVKMMRDPQDIPSFYFDLAEALIKSKKYSQALAYFKKAFENNLASKQYHHEEYGFVLHHKGLFEEALVQFEHMRKLNPTERAAFNNVAHLTYCAGRVREALEGFEYIIENGLQTRSTYANFILVLHHLDQDEVVINTYRDLLRPFINSDRKDLQIRFKEELRVTEMVLGRAEIDEKTKEFNTKKIKGINLVLSFLN